MTEGTSPPFKDRSRSGSAKAPAAPRSGSSFLEALIEGFERLPGIGRKTAERLAYHVLRASDEEAMAFAYAIRDVKKNVRHCKTCFHVTEKAECSICEDLSRDASSICVVEQPKDVYAIEATGTYRGRYHVLLGAFAPLEGVAPGDLTVDALLARVRAGGVTEVILATNPNFEGDGTALLIREKLKGIPGVRITRIARGMPSGSSMEHVSRTIVSDALEGRREMPD